MRLGKIRSGIFKVLRDIESLELLPVAILYY